MDGAELDSVWHQMPRFIRIQTCHNSLDLLGGLVGKCAYVVPCSLILTVLKAIHMHFTGDN